MIQIESSIDGPLFFASSYGGRRQPTERRCMMRDVRFLKARFHGTKETKPTCTRTQGTDHSQRRSVTFACADVHHDGDLWCPFRAESAGSGAKGTDAKRQKNP